MNPYICGYPVDRTHMCILIKELIVEFDALFTYVLILCH